MKTPTAIIAAAGLAILHALAPVAASDGTIETVLLTEDTSVSEGFVGFFEGPSLNDAGETLFLALLSGPGVNSSNDRTLIRAVPGADAEIARVGDEAPGADPNVNFDVIGDSVLNSSERSAFRAQLTGPGVNTFNREGIYSNATGMLSEVARTGGDAPGVGSGIVYNLLTDPVFNDAGQTA